MPTAVLVLRADRLHFSERQAKLHVDVAIPAIDGKVIHDLDSEGRPSQLPQIYTATEAAESHGITSTDRSAGSDSGFDEGNETTRAAEARFLFSTPLEDASLTWMTWVGRGYEPFVPPAVGETRSFPAIDLAEAFR